MNLGLGPHNINIPTLQVTHPEGVVVVIAESEDTSMPQKKIAYNILSCYENHYLIIFKN